MSDAVVLKAQKREGLKRRANEKLRSEGNVPAVIYGHGTENMNVSVPAKELAEVLARGARVLELDLDGEKQQVLLKQMQYGIYDHQLMHVDFEAVTENTKVQVSIEIVLSGIAEGTKTGGTLEQDLHEAHVECAAGKIPANITVDVTGMKVGDILHISDIPAVDGVTILNAGDTPVAGCHMPAGEEEPESAEAGEDAEPEVIGEKTEE